MTPGSQLSSILVIREAAYDQEAPTRPAIRLREQGLSLQEGNCLSGVHLKCCQFMLPPEHELGHNDQSVPCSPAIDPDRFLSVTCTQWHDCFARNFAHTHETQSVPLFRGPCVVDATPSQGNRVLVTSALSLRAQGLVAVLVSLCQTLESC